MILDPVDLTILELLHRDGRASQRRIAREMGMSAPAVADRIGRLERTAVIRGYRVEVDWSRLGFPLIVYVGVVAVQSAEQSQVVGALRALPEVEVVDVVTGPMDLLVRLRVRDHTHLREVLFDRIWSVPGVQRTETFVALTPMEPKPFDLELVRALRDSGADLDRV
ncbi:MAG: Lrp/AsnC family transcriptional regulator [Candidatus Dormibacteraeota bacterium]|nr:Lrp/AsnC family transcriptional regulator [Candidatus Dormibacteraeota bacterium]